MMVISFVLVDITVLLFLAVPMGRLIEPYPINISLAVGCSPAIGYKGILTLKDLDSIDCDFNPSVELSLTVEECGYVCMESQVDDSYQLETTSVSIHQADKKFRNGFFIHDQWNIDIICPNRGNCKLNRVFWTDDDNKEPIVLRQIELQNSSNNLFFVDKITMLNRQTRKVIQCANDYDIPVRLSSPLGNKDAIVYKICRPQCLVRTQRSSICSNQENVTEFNPQLTFWCYLILRMVFGLFWGSSMVLFDGACLSVVTQVNGDLGLQRIIGLIGLMIIGPVPGIFLNHRYIFI
jgi:hypothetical protein